MAGDGSDSAGLMFAPWVIRESEAQDRYGRIDLEQPPPKGARPAIGAPSLVVRKLETSTSHFCQGTSFIAVSWSCDGWRRHAFKLSQPSPSPSLWGFWQRIAACYQRPGLGWRSGRVDLQVESACRRWLPWIVIDRVFFMVDHQATKVSARLPKERARGVSVNTGT